MELGARQIYSAIDLALVQDIGCLVGRNGSVELEAQLHGAPYHSHFMMCAGIWPDIKESHDIWRSKAIAATLAADVLATNWYTPLAMEESAFLTQNKFSGIQIDLQSLEPYLVDRAFRWTRLLEGQNVAVISPFAETCVRQVARRKEIWLDEADSLLPATTTWIPFRTGFPPGIALGGACSWPATINDWQDAVNHIVRGVIESGAKIAIIGCGGIGMLIAAELKRYGIIAIVMGGALQILFGIKGSRWMNNPAINRFFNEGWIWASERPEGAGLIEKGCYW